jgi:polysaccharide biosynthesis protein PslH
VRILFLSRWYPFPVDNGSKIRIFNLLRGLAERHRVSLLSFYDPAAGEPDKDALLAICQDVQTVPWKPFQPDSRKSRIGFFSAMPRAYLDMYSQEMGERIHTSIKADKIDLVIASQIDMASYAGSFEGKPSVFEEVEVGIWLDRIAEAQSLPGRLRNTLTWMKHRRYLAHLMQYFRVSTVVSEKERQILRQALPDGMNIEVFPNCVDLDNYNDVTETPQPETLIFTGSLTYQPNYDAMRWFLKDVFPQVRERCPGARLFITGDHAGLPLPQVEGVTLTGMLPDVRPWIARAWCSVVPLLIGGGTRLKILEAMALNTPVITTSKGAEGLDIKPGKHLLIADEPQAFTEKIVQLFGRPDLRHQLVSQAGELVQTRYNWEIVMGRYLSMLEQFGQGESSNGKQGMDTEQV